MHVYEFPDQQTLSRLTNTVEYPTRDIEWPNVVVTTSHREYQKSISESSFTIFANKRGAVNLYTNKKRLRICEQVFYLSNPFESFDYEIDSDEPVETFNVHLNFNFYTGMQHALLNSDETLLDNPFAGNETYRYSNQLHYRTSAFNQLIQSYREEADEESFLAEILQNSLILDYREKARGFNISVAKRSTREELLKRMFRAKDWIYSNYSDSDLSVKALAELVSMSPFHFLRVFKRVYGLSPYQYLKRIRLERAKYLIRQTDMPVNQIAYAVGLKEAAAIYPLLKRELAKTPIAYRNEIRNSQQ